MNGVNECVERKMRTICVCVCAYVVRIRWSKDDFRNRLLSNQERKNGEKEEKKIRCSCTTNEH